MCAVSYEDVRAIAERMRAVPRDRLARPEDARRGARRRPHARRRPPTPRTPASTSSQDAAGRIDRVRLAARARPRVRVAALEWLDPVFVAGHWMPQLIELGRRRGRARAARRAVRAALLGAGRRGAAGGRGRDAVRLRRRARARGGRALRATSWPRSAPSGSWRSTRRPSSRGRARAWSTGWSCSPTSCTRERVPEPPPARGADGELVAGLAGDGDRAGHGDRARAPRRTPSPGASDARRRRASSSTTTRRASPPRNPPRCAP